MKVKALISFGGLFSMTLNEVTDIEDSDILDDLLQAKFVEEVKPKSDKEVNPKGKAKIDEDFTTKLSDG